MCRGRIYRGTTSCLPQMRPQQGLSAPGAVSGAPVSAYYFKNVQQNRSERYFPVGFPLPCTNRQLSEGIGPDTYFVFVIALGMYGTLARKKTNVNSILEKNKRNTTCRRREGAKRGPGLRGTAPYGVCSVPSGRRISVQTVGRSCGGYLAASRSSKSTPWPGTSLRWMAPPRYTGEPGKIANVASP